jgi:hypothetical protein
MMEKSVQLPPGNASTVVAELHELVTPAGKVWRFVSRSEGVADHAWQQRERLLQLSDGAQAVEISWECEGSAPVNVTYSPQLPGAANHA